jgi:predicted transposase YdaD
MCKGWVQSQAQKESKREREEGRERGRERGRKEGSWISWVKRNMTKQHHLLDTESSQAKEKMNLLRNIKMSKNSLSSSSN